MNEYLVFPHLLVAIGLGAAIGLERQWRQRMAGLRTNALVSGGAALFVLLSRMINTGGDQSRIPSYVVSGIGFLGAGVIMKEGSSVRGLNTAATLWCSAAIGLFAGFGFNIAAGIGTAGILATNIFLRPLAQRLNRHSTAMTGSEIRYQIKVTCRQDDEIHVRFVILQATSQSALTLHSIQSTDITPGHQNEVTAELDSLGRQDGLIEKIVSHTGFQKGVSGISWQVLSWGTLFKRTESPKAKVR